MASDNSESDIEKSIREFENRKRYEFFTGEIISGIEDDKLEQAIIDYVDFKIGNNYKKQYEIVTGLSKGFQSVYTTWWLEAEVNNGGYNQYFWNSSGEFALEAVEGFEAIGAEKNAILLKNAINIAIKELPQMKKFRDEGTLQAFSESYKHTALNDLDDVFFKYEENLSNLRIKYIRENSHLFVTK